MSASHPPASRPVVARHRVREQLESMILGGQLAAGTRLVQEELARRFKVAQGVIRESLFELKARGLVEMIDNYGVFVSRLDLPRAIEIFEIREVHEGLAARQCCARASRVHLAELAELVESAHAEAVGGQFEEAAVLDRRFHRRILEIADNATLLRLVDGYPVLVPVLKMTNDVAIVHTAHDAILKAITENKPMRAEEAMRQHIRSARCWLEEMARTEAFQTRWVF